MDTCLCCAKNLPVSGRKTCPLCGHSLMGNGWTGLDFHWKLRHEAEVPYRTFWNGLCPAHRDPSMPALEETAAAPAKLQAPAPAPPGDPLVQGLVGAIAEELWRRNHWLDLQAFRDQVDTARFDLVLSCGGWMRYLQILRASAPHGAGPFPVRSSLSQMEGGCAVVLVQCDPPQEREWFLFLGGEIGEVMPAIDAFPVWDFGDGSVRDEARRDDRYREVPESRFGPALDIAELVARLFPPAPVLRLSPTEAVPASRRRQERGCPAGRRLGDQGEAVLAAHS